MTADAIAAARRSPLHDHAARLAADSKAGPVMLREEPFLAQIALRVPEGAAATRRACAEAIGLEQPSLPERAGATAGDEGLAAMWLGPDEWVVVGAPGAETALVPALRAAIGQAHASVVDVSAARTALRLSGPAARDVLEGGCQLDLHPVAFAPGACAATTLARAAVVLHQLDGLPTYRILVRNSCAAYLCDWLLDGMSEHREDP